MGWLDKYQDGGEIEGKELPEITVYGKRQYKDKLKEQTDKYLADMAKYKQDSIQWINANKAYQDSLNVYNGAINNWEEEIKEQQEFDDKYIKELIDSPYFKSEEKERQREYLEQGRKRYLDYDDVMKESYYSIPNTNTLTPTEYGYHRVKGGGWPTNYPTGIDDYTVSILKDKSKVQPIGLTSTSEGGSHGIFKKPEKRYIPIKPDKPTGYTKINYDPTYENLRMKSLWANIAKQDTSQNIGSLENFTADPNYEKGFTIGEAVRQFPQEIKDQYNIDYIGRQVGIKKYKDGGKVKYQDGGRVVPYRNAPSNDAYDRTKPLLMITKQITPAWGKDIGDFLYDMKSDRYRSISPDSYGIENALDEQDRLKNLKGDIKINDIRNVASNRKMSHNVNSETVRKIIKASIEKGLDPNTVLAMALQETGISNINPLHQVHIDGQWMNEGYTPKTIEDADLINKNINFLSDKIKYAEKLGKTQEADIIQAWNGYGKMRPGYYGRKDTIDMDKDPVYGNRIVALRDSAILTTPEIQNIIKEEQLNFKNGGQLKKSKQLRTFTNGWVDKYL